MVREISPCMLHSSLVLTEEHSARIMLNGMRRRFFHLVNLLAPIAPRAFPKVLSILLIVSRLKIKLPYHISKYDLKLSHNNALNNTIP